MDSSIRYYKLWKIKNGWLAVTDRGNVPDGFDGRDYAMQTDCTVHHSLRAFSDYIGNQKRQTTAPIRIAKKIA